MNDPIEITLPEDSIFRKLMGTPSTDIKETENTMTDEEYNELLKGFLEYSKKQALNNKPEVKLRKKIEMMEQSRQRETFKGLKKGFLTS
jgi:hypothetical protein